MQVENWISLSAAVIALVALFFTGLQVRSAQRQTRIQEQLYKDQQQPYVWIDFRPDEASWWLIDLVLKNEGPTVARNVRVVADPPIERVSEAKKVELQTLPGFKDGFASIPPGREMRWTLGTHQDVLGDGSAKRHEVTISFDGPFGPVPSVKYVLDYADGKAMAFRERGSLKAISDALGRIATRLGSES